MRSLRGKVVDGTTSTVLGLKKLLFVSRGSVYDFRVDYKDISDRVAVLTQEIRDLQQVEQSDGNHRVNRAKGSDHNVPIYEMKPRQRLAHSRRLVRNSELCGCWRNIAITPTTP
jgi:hypothetical protein